MGLIFYERREKIMGILTHIIAFILGGNISIIIYAVILINNVESKKNRYKEIIIEQKQEIDFLKKELEEIEAEEFFE